MIYGIRLARVSELVIRGERVGFSIQMLMLPPLFQLQFDGFHSTFCGYFHLPLC
jgi:hypothetical protein